MIYLDNAATTPLDPLVLEAMLPYLSNYFGNPSSIHSHGRETRSAVEKARKTVANLLNTSTSEIFFTSGGTEADNTALQCSISAYGITHAITSRIEHHAVLHCLQQLERQNTIKLSYVAIDEIGNLDLDHLQQLLKAYPNSLVSLMHANNELGNVNDLHIIGSMCEEAGATFHSDTVQTVGHFKHDLQELNTHFIVGSAHKFHGPKGIGFLYASGKKKLCPLIFGGAQERNMRGGTENVYGIVGLAKALELAYQDMHEHHKYIQALKDHAIKTLMEFVPGVSFNGNIVSNESLYTVLNVSLPESENNDMLLFNLDIHKISASGGSACSSGADVGSHVLQALGVNENRGHLRLSFSKYNTLAEINETVQVLSQLYKN